MNPYNFVPVDFSRSIERRPIKGNDRLSGITGSITCSIKAETPIFIKGTEGGSITNFFQIGGNYAIPSTTLKGLFRNLVETIGHGCFGGMFKGNYKDKARGIANYNSNISSGFKQCPVTESGTQELCTGCRLFGWMVGNKMYKGKVSFSDAICHSDNAIFHEPVYTVELQAPKPHHAAFYLNNKMIAGRKYYYHFPQGINTVHRPRIPRPKIKPLGTGSFFEFDVFFHDIQEDELDYLIYAIALEENMRHKIGYGKPSGLGTVKIKIDSIYYQSSISRYTGNDLENANRVARQKNEINDFIMEKTKSLREDKSSNMQMLREIWYWDPNSTIDYKYPTSDSSDWFEKNPDKPILQTP